MIRVVIPVGQRFGRLILERLAGADRNGRKIVRCLCDCGERTDVMLHHLKAGRVTSCGCFRREHSAAKFRTHGMTGTKEHRAWKQMIRRCCCKTSKGYENYGGRGIRVCDRWRRSFENFFADVGPAPSPLHSIDRRDNEGNYEPSNVGWATKSEQCNNQRRTHLVTRDGKTLSLKQWAKVLGVDYKALHNRISLGWTIERAFSTTYRRSPLRS